MTNTTSDTLPELRAGSFTLNPAGSKIGFSTRNLIGLPVAGEFHDFRADMKVGATPADSTVSATVVISGMNTQSRMRDRDLQKKKIFDSATWPDMRFSSTAITTAGDAITITGELTVRDQSRRVTLAGSYTGTTPNGGHRFEVGAVVNPRDFGITHPAIRRPVKIQVTAELIPALPNAGAFASGETRALSNPPKPEKPSFPSNRSLENPDARTAPPSSR